MVYEEHGYLLPVSPVQERCDVQSGFLLLSFLCALSDLYHVSNLQVETCDLTSLYFISLTYVFRIILVLTLQCCGDNYRSYLQTIENFSLFYSFLFCVNLYSSLILPVFSRIESMEYDFHKLYHYNYVSIFQM